jgi:hypothetical protein
MYKNSAMTEYARKNMELKLQTRSVRQLYIKIEIIDTNDDVINEVSGSAIGGSYNIDNAAAIRRTCSITFNLEQGYLPDENSVFWINKRFQLYIGLKNIETNEIYWFNKGVYAIKDPAINISISGKTIQINGLDKMALHNGDISGQLSYATSIEVKDGVYVHDAVRAIMLDGGETNLLISNTDLQIPYKIESAIGDVRWDVINKLTELFYNYQAFYDLDGYFVFTQKPMYKSEGDIVNNISIDFSKEYKNNSLESKPYNLIISINREIAYSNIKNKIVVYGGVHEDGYQPRYEILVANHNYPTSPYTIEKLNERNSDNTLICRTLVVQDESYVDDGSVEGVFSTVLIPENSYQFEMARNGNKTLASFSQIILPSYCEVDIPNVNNSWGVASNKQCVYYDVIWDGTAYSNLTPKHYYGTTYYVGNGAILEAILESGDPYEDTGEPFVCWYNGVNFGIYIEGNIDVADIKKHTVKFTRKETTNHAYSINLCQQRAEQEVYLHQQATDKVVINCLPIYSLDVNDVIYLNDDISGAIGEYVINNISCGLGAGDTMTINANKLW